MPIPPATDSKPMLPPVGPFLLPYASERKPAGWRWLGALVGASAGALLAYRTDWHAAFALLGNMGHAWPLAGLPFLLGMVFATGAWRITLVQLGHKLPFLPLLRLRLVAEALVTAVPAGALVAEAVKPLWAQKRFGLPITEGIASGGLVKAFSMQAEGVYLLLAFTAAYPQWRAVHVTLTGTTAWFWQSLPLVGIALLALGSGTIVALQGGGAMRAIDRGLALIPISAVARWLTTRQRAFAQINRDFAHFFAKKGAQASALVMSLCLGQWLMEALETYVIFRLLGAGVRVEEALLIEALTSAVKCALFFLPGGLGAMEVTTYLLLGALGVVRPVETTAAFAFTKRSKDVFWILTSLAMSLVKVGSPSPRVREPL